MKVLVVGRTLPTHASSSYGLFEFNQARALNKRYQTGYLFIENSSLKSNRQLKSLLSTQEGIPVSGIYLPIKGLPGSIFDNIRTKLFIKAFERFEQNFWTPDILHVHFPLLTLNEGILLFLKQKKIQLIVTEHWTNVQSKHISLKHQTLLKSIVAYAGNFICVSETLKKSVIELTQADANKISVIPNMIATRFFNTKYHYDSEQPFVFTYIGRITKVKRVDLLIEAFLTTFDSIDSVKLNIIGDGPLRKKLQRKVPLEYQKIIEFKGSVSNEEVKNYLLKTAVFVSASNLETFGVPFIEAMAMGLPVIGADNLPISNVITPETGRLFKVDNLNSLQIQLKDVYEKRNSFVTEKIKQQIFSTFSEQAVMDELESIYKQII